MGSTRALVAPAYPSPESEALVVSLPGQNTTDPPRRHTPEQTLKVKSSMPEAA